MLSKMNFDAKFFLRIGLAFVFVYAAISAFIDPEAWIGFVPSWVGNIERAYTLFVHDIVNLVLGLWLLSGRKTYWASVVSAVVLAVIVLVNLGSFIITFRDIGLFFAAVALAIMSKK